jgi:hypothetical protein
MPDKKTTYKKNTELVPKDNNALKSVENFIANKMRELPEEFEKNKIKSSNIRNAAEERRERLQNGLQRPKNKFSL